MTQQGSSSSASSFSFSKKWTYDVFLSFRGKDTRIGFTGNLYNTLHQRGIRTFMDDPELKKGEEIKPGLVKAIQESRISIVVFSENYADSRFCLDELVTIIDCIEEKGRLVLPVFYNVIPAQIRHQTEGSYAAALARHETAPHHGPEKVKKWRSALSKAANLSGYPFDGEGLEYEYVFIRKIIEEVNTKINRIPLHVADHPVGLESRLCDVKSLLDVGSGKEVKMVGIYGMGGIGKSTIARAVYNLIADRFEDICFLSNVRENSIKLGLTQLQETLLFELTGERDIKFGDVNIGIPILKSRLNQKKVLLLLDDIDKPDQLQALAGGVDWFGSGSRIIITTRDTHLLSVHGIYNMKELNDREARELFIWKAFKRSNIDPNFEAFVERVVHCGHGLPLALEVIGSNLDGISIDEWDSALSKYEKNSHGQVQEVLKVSYNSLEPDEKEIFLDIACFFSGETLQYVKNILLHSRDLSPEYAIGVLIRKSLIKVTKSLKLVEKVEIHDLIQDMARNIVNQDSPLEPGGRSRLWFHEDIIRILEGNRGTDKIQSVLLDLAKHEVRWSGNEFKKMTNLRVLIIKDVKFSQGPRYLPNSLRVLDWKRYPSSSLPSEFHPEKLLILNLYGSFFALGKAFKKFEQLCEINFVCCKFLKQIPDLSKAPNLIELHLNFCKQLTEIHDSVRFLDKLRIISAKSCVSLKIFPSSIQLKSLQMLNLMCCSSLKYFPEVPVNLDNLSYISLRETAIEELPCSIQNVTGLLCLDLSSCRRLKKVPTCILKLPKLERLHLSKGAKHQLIRKFGEQEQVISTEKQICLGGCNFLDGFLPPFLGCFPNMTSLELQGSNLTILPECVQVCQHLSNLNLDNCKQLREIRAIPPKIEVLSARNCTSLMPSAFNLLLDEDIHSRGNTWFTLPGTRMPQWIDFYGKTSLSFWFRNKFPDVVQFVIGRPMFGSLSFKCSISVNGRVLDEWNHSYSELETRHTFLYNLRLHHDHDFEKYEMVYLEDEWNQAEISFVSKTFEVGRRNEPLVQEKGIYIFDRDRIKRDILFTNPNQYPNPTPNSYPNPKPMKKQLRWNYQILGLKCCLLLLRVMAIASGY